MQVEITNIVVTMTQREALILSTVFDHFGEDDPYGAASEDLGTDINEVVETIRSIQDPINSILRCSE
jgi:hypothetical protein